MSIAPALPHSPDAERAFLGGFIIAGKGPVLDASDLFLPFHQSLYRGIRRLQDDGKPIDLVLLSEQLTRSELADAGGIDYVAGMVSGIPKVSNLEHYAEIIRTKAAVRRGYALCTLMADKLAAANGDASEVLRDVSALSAPLREEVAQKRILAFKTGVEFAAAAEEHVEWIARGLVATGAITELGAKIKAGKTTLLLAMIHAIINGLPFLGLLTRKTPILYLTEQPVVSFRQALERAQLLDCGDLHILAYSDVRGLPWPTVASAAVQECKRTGATLIVIDTLPQFAGLTGDRENNSGDALEAMGPLQLAAAEDIGVLLVRHERKSGGDVGDSGRGSSAFAGAVDVVLSLRKPEGNAPKTRRLLQSLSRFSETPTDLLIDLTDDGYVALGQVGETAVKEAKDAILAAAPRTETEAADLKELVDRTEVSRRTAQRAVDELVRDGMLSRIGQGKRGNPFRYFIPEKGFCATSYIEGQKETNLFPEGAPS